MRVYIKNGCDCVNGEDMGLVLEGRDEGVRQEGAGAKMMRSDDGLDQVGVWRGGYQGGV